MQQLTLHGEFSLRFDVKSRLTLPREMRRQMDALGSTALIARGGLKLMESSVWLYPDSYFDKLCADQIPPDDLGFDLRMFDVAMASRLAWDKRGRVTVPNRLLSYYGIIEPEVTLVGVNDRFELWSRSSWQEHRARLITRSKPLSLS